MTESPRGAVDAGVFVAALVLLFVSAAQGWNGLMVVSGVVLLAVMVTTAARRQHARGERQPRDGDRPWRRDDERPGAQDG